MAADAPKDPKKVRAGRMGAHAVHARGLTNTGPAIAAMTEKFYDEVDPERVLSEDERTKRAAHARSLHMSRLAAKRWKR
jgi:CHAD domain-containing protein